MENIDKIMGEIVRRARKKAKMSQKDLAKSAKCSLTTINRFEKGRQQPHTSLIREIARVLGLNYSDFPINNNSTALIEKLESIETFSREMVDEKIKSAVNEYAANIFDGSARGKLLKLIYELDESEAKIITMSVKNQLESSRSLKASKLDESKKKRN